MKIIVTAHNPPHNFYCRAGRVWSTSDPTEVEVLDQDADPAEVLIPVKNSTTGKDVETKRPDPKRIGRKTLAILEADGKISIKQLDGISSKAADAAVRAAREEVSRLSQELVGLKAELAKAESDRDEAIAARDVAQAELAKLAAEVQAQAEADKPESGKKSARGK